MLSCEAWRCLSGFTPRRSARIHGLAEPIEITRVKKRNGGIPPPFCAPQPKMQRDDALLFTCSVQGLRPEPARERGLTLSYPRELPVREPVQAREQPSGRGPEPP